MIKIHLSKILGERRMKVSDLARETGVNRGALHRMYHEDIVRLDLEALDKLCAYLDCEVQDLIEYQPD